MGRKVFRRGAAVVAALALVSATLGVVSSSPSVAADCGERVLLVAGSSRPPAGDASLLDALTGRSPGASCLVVVDDDVVNVAQAEGFDVVVIASSVLPLTLGDRLVDAQVPVLVSEPFLFDDMAMTVGNGKELAGRTSVKITDGSHPLAGGLSGTVTVLEMAAKVNYGVDGRAPGVEAVANTGGSSPRMTIFGFAAGAELTDRVAAAGRVGFFASYGADLTDDGTTLFNAAIDWLVGQGVSEPTDGDAVTDVVDNCPYVGGEVAAFNILQRDTDQDGAGDSCDPSSTAPSSGLFTDSGQLGGSLTSSGAQLGDLDGDGDLDAVVSNQNSGVTTPLPSRVWFNDGSGSFTDSGQAIRTGENGSIWVELGDVDGDGDLDIILSSANAFGQIWLNDGNGVFADSGQVLGDQESLFVPGDFDGDDDLDLIAGDWISSDGVANRVWLNDGSGTFTNSGQLLGSDILRWSGIGDLDADGDVDAFISGASDSRVWFNNGNGVFTDSGQRLGRGGSSTWGVGLGDLDADGDLDAFVTTTGNAPDQVWLNDGTGTFTDSGQRIGADSNVDVELGDLDGDGDLDAFVPANGSPYVDRVWTNDGTGNFSDTGQALGASRSQGVALGDLDGDHDLDAYIANWWGTNFVYLNDVNTEPPPRALLVAGNTSPPPGDRDIVDIMEAAGVEVTVVDDDSDLSAIDASGYDVVVVSTSVVPSKVGDVFADVLVPVVIWEPYLFDDMAMTERGPRETSVTYRDVTIVDATHPLADGLAVGNARVYDVARTLSYGAAADAAEIVAQVPGKSSQDVMFVLDPGDVRADGSVSPALRVGLFPTYPGALRLSDQGKALMASAVEWVLAGGPPGNDDFADRFTLTGTTATGDNVGATAEDGEPNHWSGPTSSVWWQWTATIDGGAVIDTNGSGFDTVLAVYQGAQLSSLAQLDADDDGGDGLSSKVRFAVDAGETYHVVVDGYNGAHGDYVLNVVEQARPVNDDFADRLPLGYGSVVTTNVGATVEPGEPGARDNTLWWTWTAPSDGMFVFDTSGSDPDTAVTLWTGDELASLVEAPPVWSGNGRRVDAVEGTTYQVSVGSWDSSGLVQLNVLGAEGVVGSVLPIAAHWSLEMVLDDDGYPVIGYSEWETSSNEWTAKLIHCNDPLCEGGDDEPVVIASSASVNGLALDASGSPVMVIAEGVIGKLVHCNDPGCLGDDETISTLPHWGDLALDEAGFPVIATTGGGELRVTRCNDPDCAGGDERTEVVDEPRADSRLSGGSLALDRNGFPVLAYSDYTSWEEGVGASVKVARCNDRFCAGGDESIVEFGGSEHVPDPGLVLDDSDRPIVVYTDDSFIFSGVVLVRCVDLTCADRAETGIGDFYFSRGNTVGIGPGDRPIVGYTHSEGDGLSIAVCRSDDCSAQSLVDITPPGDWDGISGLVLSIASDGTPVLAFTSWDRSADIDTLVLARLVGLRVD